MRWVLFVNSKKEFEMKKYLAPVVILLTLLLLPAISAAGSVGLGFVDLPDQVETGITAVIVFAVSWLFVQLITLVPFLKFLDEFKLPLAMAVSAQVITWIENIVPDAFGNVTIAGIVFVLAILSLFGIGNQLRKMNAPGFRSRS